MKKQKEELNETKVRIPKWVLLILLLNLAGIIGIGGFLIIGQKKTAFVDLGKLYEGFELTKRKSSELQNMNFGYKNTLDSMALEIKSLEDELVLKYDKVLDDKIQLKKINYYKIEENMQAALEEAKAKADEQIWQQINSYTQDFGKEKGYDYIYGGNGSGSLMYANDAKDISEEVLVFINKKFVGE